MRRKQQPQHVLGRRTDPIDDRHIHDAHDGERADHDADHEDVDDADDHVDESHDDIDYGNDHVGAVGWREHLPGIADDDHDHEDDDDRRITVAQGCRRGQAGPARVSARAAWDHPPRA
jgi:hypothetical protein